MYWILGCVFKYLGLVHYQCTHIMDSDWSVLMLCKKKKNWGADKSFELTAFNIYSAARNNFLFWNTEKLQKTVWLFSLNLIFNCLVMILCKLDFLKSKVLLLFILQAWSYTFDFAMDRNRDFVTISYLGLRKRATSLHFVYNCTLKKKKSTFFPLSRCIPTSRGFYFVSKVAWFLYISYVWNIIF